jgi:PPM family protein phosphatase
MTLALRYTVKSDVGLLREGNEDSAYAGPHLLAIADGMGGHAAGEVASAVAISTLAPLDTDTTGLDMLQALADAVSAANATLNQITVSDPTTEGMGTTLTALLWSGADVALCHIGDSRAYLLREGSFQQITHDHTLVQSLVDEGRLTPEAAASHPQRSLVMRALQSSIPADPDLIMLRAQVGDRYLLCSDGLSDVVSDETLGKTLTDLTDLDEAVERLVDLAIRSGGPDNITCVLADVVDPSAGQVPSDAARIAGAIASGESAESAEPTRSDSPAARAHLLTRGHGVPTGQEQGNHGDRGTDDTGPASEGGEDAADAERPDQAEDDDEAPILAGRRRWPVVTGVLVLLIAVVGGGGYYGWTTTQNEYYVGSVNGKVAVFRGVNQAVAGVSLYSVVQQTDIPLSEVPTAEAKQILATLPPGTLAQAQRTVTQISRDYRCAVAQTEIKTWLARQQRTARQRRPVARHTARHPSSRRAIRRSRATPAATASATPSPTVSPTPGSTDSKGSMTGNNPSTQPRPVLPRYCAASSGGSE